LTERAKERRRRLGRRRQRGGSIATLYDVHGNLRALEAVLAEIPDDATIVVGGDVVAGGEQPGETLERLRGLGDRVRWLRGNADRELMPGEEGLAPPELIEATRAQLSQEQIEFLHALPETVQIDRVLFCHATQRNDVDIFTERTPEERIAPLFADVNADVVVVGHTHTQFERVVAGRRVLNSGSVGLPYEDEPGAYWTLDLVHRRTPYDGAALTQTREQAVLLFTERGL
jgi:putative phosphoesterase